MDYKERMTDAMLEVYTGFDKKMEKEYLYCLNKLKEANRAANISLPHMNERVLPVVHGARMAVSGIRDYWYSRLNNASSFVSWDFINKHHFHKYIE